MTRFLLCSFALVLLYPSGIDMYLVGLPRIAQVLGASEAQLHIAFSVYLAGMASAMLFAGRIADRSGRKPVAIVGAVIFVVASLLCAQAHASSHFLAGRFIQGIGAGSCYVVAFAILRDTLDDRRRAKVLSLLNGITCIIPVLAPVLGHLIMLKYPWQSLFYTMTGMGVMVGLLSVFILRETRPTAHPQTATPQHGGSESLLNRFFLSRILITTLSVTAILTYVNVSPVLMMEEMGFDRGTYSMAMALMAMISMAVSFSTPFALSLFTPRTLMLTSQVLFLAAGLALSLSTRQTLTLIGLGMICAGFSVGFGVSVLGIAQVCGSSLWIWLAAIIGLSAMNMLIGILIACSIVSLVLLLVVTPPRVAQYDEEAAVES
ncbi:MAG: MFS transporter [Klebsiella sp.]|nr:MFS transporter [Klebsiella sp.]